MPTSVSRGRLLQLLSHLQTPAVHLTRPSASCAGEKHALAYRPAATLGMGKEEPHWPQNARPPPVGCSPTGLRGEAGRGLARGTVGKAWTVRPARTRRGLGGRGRSGVGRAV